MTGDSAEKRVYPVREDSRLLLPFARCAPGERILEVGCGRGTAALVAARAGGRVVATDLNPWAVRFVRDAARAEGLPVEVVRTDLARGLRRFDRILANPPYLPTPPAARDPDRWVNLALDGGPDGLAVTSRLFAEVASHLTPNGRAFLLISSRQPSDGLARLAEGFRASGGAVREVAGEEIGGERLAVLELTVPRRAGPG